MIFRRKNNTEKDPSSPDPARPTPEEAIDRMIAAANDLPEVQHSLINDAYARAEEAIGACEHITLPDDEIRPALEAMHEADAAKKFKISDVLTSEQAPEYEGPPYAQLTLTGPGGTHIYRLLKREDGDFSMFVAI